MNEKLYTEIIGACALRHDRYSCIRLSGADHSDLLHRLTTNEMRQLQDGEGQVTVFCNEVGRIIARAMLLRFDTNILLMTDKSAGSALTEWIEKYVFIEDVKVEDLSKAYTTITIIGPGAVRQVTRSFGWNLSGLDAWQHRTLEFQGGVVHVFVCNYLEVPTLVFVSEKQLTDEIEQVLRSHDCPELDNAGYDVVRIASGWPAADIDYSGELNPHEAGMLAYINFDKGCYIGQEVIARLDTYEKVKKRLVRLALQSDNLVSPQSAIVLNNEEIGYITSSACLPQKNQVLALGYVKKKAVSDGQKIIVQHEESSINGYLEILQ